MLEGYPSRRIVKLRYVTHFTLAPALESFVTKDFRANSTYDPDYNLGGTSATGHTQWSEFYTFCTVLGSKCKFFPIDNGGSISPAYFGIHLTDLNNELQLTYGTTGINDMLMSKKMSRHLLVAGSRDMNKLNQQYALHKFSAKKAFGSNVMANNNAGSLVTSIPQDPWYFSCWCSSVPGLAAPNPTVFRVEIDFIVMFTKPRLLDPPSLLTLEDEKESEKKMFLNMEFNSNLPLGENLENIVDSLLDPPPAPVMPTRSIKEEITLPLDHPYEPDSEPVIDPSLEPNYVNWDEKINDLDS